MLGPLLSSVLALLVTVVVVEAARQSRPVRTRQGRLQGIVLVPDYNNAQPVEAFLGVPYAAPPVGRLRFMPPGSPRSWEQTKNVSEFGPVCPQIIPDLSKEKEALRYMTVGRMEYLKKLFNYLKQKQSEDCLYLNVYTPESAQTSQRLPVIVFIHGESYEWNSGNPYDGSVLASYGQVVVITINYRLGLLGFLKTESRTQMGNYGLLDILAALHWIQENISQFGGDPDGVTLLGQGTGAALTSLLLLSPITQANRKLFHRAILTSGSSLANSAIVTDPLDVMEQVASHTQCPINSRFSNCLRDIDVKTLMDVSIKSQLYSSPVGPYVDGTIVPEHPDVLMKKYSSKYDLLFGVTESEAYFLFPAFTVSYGVTDTEQRNILRSLLTSEYGVAGDTLEQIVKMVDNEYRDFHQIREDKQINLKMLLDIFSDGRVVAPVLKSANLHSNNRKSSYLYIFKQVTENGFYPKQFGSIHGEDLAYILGMPLVGGTYHFVHNYTQEEKMLSENFMAYLVNFAKSGDPGSRSFPGRRGYNNPIQWPKYESNSRRHLELGPEVKVGSHYRSDKIAVWNKLIPDIISSSNTTRSNNPVIPPFPPPKFTPDERHAPPNDQLRGDSPGLVNLGKKRDDSRHVFLINDNIPVSIVVILGLILLMFNLLACAGVYYQKQKVKRREMNLERRIKRMSDAGFVVDDSASHQSGLIVDSNVERETRDEAHYGTLNSTHSAASAKRPHFQLRSNSVREQTGDQNKVALKSALKKSNTSAEVLTDNCRDSKCLLYTDKTFADAAYPRQAKSIPNITHYNDNNANESARNDASLSRTGKEKPLSRSSNFLEKEKKRGADELVMYDSLPSPSDTLEDRRKEGGAGTKLSSLASSILRGSGLKKDGRPPSPIIEMKMVQTSSTPSTYNFPSRQVNGEPIYSTRPLLSHRAPLAPIASPYGIAYPVYSHTGSLPRPLYPSLPPQPHDQYISMMARPGLTTPRHGLHLPLLPAGSLPTNKARHAWTGPLREDQCLYGVRPPPPGIPRINSLDSNNSPPDLLPVKMANATSQTPQQAKYVTPSTTSPTSSGSSQASQQAKYVSSTTSPTSPASSGSSQVSLQAKYVSSTSSPASSGSSQTSQQAKYVTPSTTSPASSGSSGSSQASQQAKYVSSTTSPTTSGSSPASQQSKYVIPSTVSPASSGSSQTPLSSASSTSSSQSQNARIEEGLNGSTDGGKSENKLSNDDKERSPIVSTPSTPVLRKVGEKTPPNTLKRDRPQSSCKSWYSQYSQGFLSKTIDTPEIELPPLGDEEDDETDSDKSPNNERKMKE